MEWRDAISKKPFERAFMVYKLLHWKTMNLSKNTFSVLSQMCIVSPWKCSLCPHVNTKDVRRCIFHHQIFRSFPFLRLCSIFPRPHTNTHTHTHVTLICTACFSVSNLSGAEGRLKTKPRILWNVNFNIAKKYLKIYNMIQERMMFWIYIQVG